MIKNIDNLDKFFNEALFIREKNAIETNSIGYIARAITQATMPHSKIDGNNYIRKNGFFTLTMLASPDVGLPYGVIPRLLMSWITTEVVRTKSREIILGSSLSEFMSELGIVPTGGRWGSITRLKEQMKRLFSASVSCTYDNGKNWKIYNLSLIEKADLWWDPKNPEQSTIWSSKLLLGNSFFEEIIESPIPVDMRAIKLLKKSPMAIDIYCWLTYRMSYLRRDSSIPWNLLMFQFGSNYSELRQFKRRFIEQLRKVLVVYPDANVVEGDGVLILKPSKSHVPSFVSHR